MGSGLVRWQMQAQVCVCLLGIILDLFDARLPLTLTLLSIPLLVTTFLGTAALIVDGSDVAIHDRRNHA